MKNCILFNIFVFIIGLIERINAKKFSLYVPGNQFECISNKSLRINSINIQDSNGYENSFKTFVLVNITVSNGDISLLNPNGLQFFSSYYLNKSKILFLGSIATTQEALSTLIYTPHYDFYGNDKVNINVNYIENPSNIDIIKYMNNSKSNIF